MLDAVSVWIHVIAVACWIGPQFFLFIVAIPAIRTIEDAQLRAKLLRTIVTRFGWMAWTALGVILLTGLTNLLVVSDEAPFDLWNTDYRWYKIFLVKMALVATMLALTAFHTFVVGPRQLRLAEQLDADERDVVRLRRQSIILSSGALLASIAAVYCGVLLADHNYSFVGG